MNSEKTSLTAALPRAESRGWRRWIKDLLSPGQRRRLRGWARAPHVPLDAAYCFLRGIPYRADWDLRGFPVLVRARGGRLAIGRRWKAVSRLTANSLGVTQPVYIHIGPDATVEIGDDVGMSGCSIAAKTRITIGDRVLLGSGAVVTDNDAHPVHPDVREDYSKVARQPVVIGNDVFVGARAIILKGVTLGRGSVVGAGAVVTRSVPDYAIVAGNPAKVIGDSRRAPR